MRRDLDHYGDRDLDLLFIAKKLNEALVVEKLLTDAGLDYAVETDNYQGGVMFRSERVGAFFYVTPEVRDPARETLRGGGYKPWEGSPQ